MLRQFFPQLFLQFLILFTGLIAYAGPAEDPLYEERNERFKDYLTNGTADTADYSDIDPNYPMFSKHSDMKGTTLVVYAAQQGKWSVVEKLIKLPINDINKAPEGGSYKGLPLAWYLARSDQEVSLCQLIETYSETIDFNVGKWDGDTQLDSVFSHLINNKMPNALKKAILLSKSSQSPIDYNHSLKKNDETNLWLLAKAYPSLIRSVIAKFSDLNVNAGINGETVFSLMTRRQTRDWESAQLMLEHAQPNILPGNINVLNQNSPLMEAIKSSQWNAANLMIKKFPQEILQKVSASWQDYDFFSKLTNYMQWELVDAFLPATNSSVVPSGTPRVDTVVGQLLFAILYPKTILPLETLNYHGNSLARNSPGLFKALQQVDLDYRQLVRPSDEGLLQLLRALFYRQHNIQLPDNILMKLYNAYSFAAHQQKLLNIAEELYSQYVATNNTPIESDFCTGNSEATCKKKAVETLIHVFLEQDDRGINHIEQLKRPLLIELIKIDKSRFNERTVKEAFSTACKYKLL